MDVTGLSAAVTEQGSPEEVTDCCQAIISYPVGYRIELPEFGLPDQTFRQGGASESDITAALQAWESRAEVLANAEPDLLDILISRAHIQISTEEE
jgi:phage baseplate assembly protein W